VRLPEPRKVASDTSAADGGTVWAEFVSTSRGTYRIHTVFAGDAENLADTSPWAYFKITKEGFGEISSPVKLPCYEAGCWFLLRVRGPLGSDLRADRHRLRRFL
jgi:hypothetical protein